MGLTVVQKIMHDHDGEVVVERTGPEGTVFRLWFPGKLAESIAEAPIAANAQTVTLFGAPSNFDVYNDTGQIAYGFEVEMQGITAGDLAGVWPSSRFPYTVRTIPGGIVIHYASRMSTMPTRSPPSLRPRSLPREVIRVWSA
jgi:hypothetical protein